MFKCRTGKRKVEGTVINSTTPCDATELCTQNIVLAVYISLVTLKPNLLIDRKL